MAIIQIRIDEQLKSKATAVYNEIGVDISTAIRIFLKKSVAVGGFPFDTKIDGETLRAILSLDRMRDTSEQNGNSEMTLDEINHTIHQTRVERKKKN